MKLHKIFRNESWREVRLDIDPGVSPDIVASMTDMSMVKTGSMGAIWSSHNLEHLYSHEVPVALAEFRRVLDEDGFALITLPDLRQVAALIADDKLEEPAYISPRGPISPLDILYGHRASIVKGNFYMAHRTGFTAKSLAQAIVAAGFVQARVTSDKSYNLWAIAYKRKPEIKAGENSPPGPGAEFPLD